MSKTSVRSRSELTCAQNVHTLAIVNVIWDPLKASTNKRKHGVDFADAALALEDLNALTISVVEGGEYRFKTLCRSPETNVLLVVHAEEGEDSIVIISARVADAHLKRQYLEGDYRE